MCVQPVPWVDLSMVEDDCCILCGCGGVMVSRLHVDVTCNNMKIKC